MRKLLIAFAMILVLATMPASGIAATTTPTSFGVATYNASGIELTSDSSLATPYGGIDFPAFVGATLSSITSLGAEYQMITGDCTGGSPRYSISLSGGSNIFVYFGDAPNYHCGSAQRTQANLLTPNVDTGQLAGGTFYDTWDHALTLAGSQTITELAIVVDGSWATTQVVEISSATINDTTYNFAPLTSVQQCMNGGWMNSNNPAFNSQVECIHYFQMQRMQQSMQRICERIGNPWFCNRIGNESFSIFSMFR